MTRRADVLSEVERLEGSLEAYQEARADLLERVDALDAEIEEIEYQIWQLKEPSPDRDEEE